MAQESPGELHHFLDDVEELLRRVSDLGDEELASLRGRVESSILHARTTAGSGIDAAMGTARAAAHDADSFVRGNPWMAVGIAAAAGLLLGGLLGRK